MLREADPAAGVGGGVGVGVRAVAITEAGANKGCMLDEATTCTG